MIILLLYIFSKYFSFHDILNSITKYQAVISEYLPISSILSSFLTDFLHSFAIFVLLIPHPYAYHHPGRSSR